MQIHIPVGPNQGSPPQEPAFLPVLLLDAAFALASSLAWSAAAASLGRVIRCTASFTLLPVSIASSGSFLNLQNASEVKSRLLDNIIPAFAAHSNLGVNTNRTGMKLTIVHGGICSLCQAVGDKQVRLQLLDT